MEAGAPVCPTERRNSQPAAAGRRTEGGIPRLRVAGVRSPRAAYRAVPGASAFPTPPPREPLPPWNQFLPSTGAACASRWGRGSTTPTLVASPTLGLVASSAAWRLGLPVVATSHTWFTRSLAYRFFRPVLQRRLDRVAARIAVSEPVVRAMSMYFRADWEIIPNGVNVEYFHPNGRRPTDYLGRGPRLLFLGRLDPRNGLDTVLGAMPTILARYPVTKLVVVGDGPLRAHYERRAMPLGSSVKFVGQINDERPEYYATADLYLCPTTKASFGITLLEAMACGTPMIVSDITGFRELIAGGGEAVLVPKDDPAAWARTTMELMADAGRREAMAAAGLAKAARFAWPRVADRVLAVYERVTR